MRTATPTRSRRADISPLLPQVTRERNSLLSAFYTQLHRPAHQLDQEQLWAAFANLVSYPDVIPALPRSLRPTSERMVGSDGQVDDTRRPIQLSEAELRKCFTALAKARPCTRVGLSRLLVVVELIARRRETLPAPSTGDDYERADPTERKLEELRGGGLGLRDEDWENLILFATTSWRTPRKTHEVPSATALLSQWERTNLSSDLLPPKPSKEMYNILLTVAARSRAWDLVEDLEERMKRDGVKHDSATVGARLRRGFERGAHIQTLWSMFEEGVVGHVVDQASSRSEGSGIKKRAGGDTTPLWNSILSVLSSRGHVEDARRVYDAMREGAPIDVGSLRPEQEGLHSPRSSNFVLPPPPNASTYLSMIKTYSTIGDLRTSLKILQDMVAPSPTAPAITNPPSVAAFTAIFKGFAIHGEPTEGHRVSPFDSRSLSSRPARIGNKRAQVQGAAILAALQRSPSRPQPVEASTTWTLPTLEVLFKAFISLTAPPLSPSFPHGGYRSAPQPRQLYYLVMAFDRVSSGDYELVLEKWEEVERVFGGSDSGWRGWVDGGRVGRMIGEMRRAVEERRRAEEKWRREMGIVDS
ncbi:hypothetical protein MNV49_001455 [Pseudohyphozyma bogoriensis]|nr:hypothetical protein MNV49_001455 [Pseudohyphozyma bogoriensis]